MQKRFTTTVKHLQKDKRKLLTISVGCDCSSSTNPLEAGGGGLAGGGVSIGYWPWSACDEEVEDPCDIRALEGLACGDSAGVKAIAKLNACVWNSCQFRRGIRLILSNIHWKKLTLSCSCWSSNTVREQPTRWFAESFITSTISFNFDDFSSLSLSVLFFSVVFCSFLGSSRGHGMVQNRYFGRRLFPWARAAFVPTIIVLVVRLMFRWGSRCSTYCPTTSSGSITLFVKGFQIWEVCQLPLLASC